ncbi:MAG: alpha-1,2-fucosyltransferase [Patescibacteria group bacterium]
MKKAIILQHGGGELANQLWNYISIYAYCLEQKIECENYSFFEYAHFFDIPSIKNKIFYFLFFGPFHNYIGRRNSFRTRFFRTLYKTYVFFEYSRKRGSIISSINSNNKPFYLPPTLSGQHFLKTEKENKVFYFEGWLFRNPGGIKKYRDAIIHYFIPRESIRYKVKSVIVPLRKRFNHIVGVHLRQEDYATFKNGQYALEHSRMFEVLKEYLKETKKGETETVFVVTSDGDININDFPGLNIFHARGNAAQDLFTLAATDIVIGSDSSFGNLAAYFGNIPHVVITKEPIDWAYYQGKIRYFPTKYCTMVHY